MDTDLLKRPVSFLCNSYIFASSFKVLSHCKTSLKSNDNQLIFLIYVLTFVIFSNIEYN